MNVVQVINEIKMKRFIVFVAALLLSVSAFAGVVTKSQAENVAKNVLGASSVQYVWNGLGDKVYGDVHPAFYVFDGNGQWAIIAADDCATPVLMHGNGSFDLDKVPANMLSLLGDVEYNIFTARHRKLAQSPEIKQAWFNYSVVTKAGGSSPVEKFVIDKEGNTGTALWNQGSPYNLKCPAILNQSDYWQYNNEGHCYAGCVAAAMAIIMRFHEWPAYGEGTIPGYTTVDGYTVPDICIDGYEYNWADLPISDAWDSYYYSNINEWSQPQIDRVGDILYQCGAMVNMDYGPFGSGAASAYALDALQEYMSYSKDAKHLLRSRYTNQQWYNMIKAELDANRPLFYHGQDIGEQGGHAFVCDGYNSNNEVHINWGWGGMYYATSWFAVCYLGPASGELDDAVYSSSDGAFFGLVPATGTESGDEVIPEIAVCDDYSGGISLVSGTVATGSSFQLNISSIWNISGSTYSGQAKAALLNKDGEIKEFISPAESITLGNTYLYVDVQFDCIINEDIALGDYISIMYSYGDNKWAPIDKYWEDSSNPIIKLYLIDITLIDIPSTFTAGQICYPNLLFFTNKSADSVTWSLDGEMFTAEYIKMTAGDHTFKAVITYSDNSTETIVKKVTVE